MGSGKGGASNNNNTTTSKKMIASLKEIVNCPESEIYAMLLECNMDPNETVNRLLSQDPFHEVKSKREKKKENKDVGDLRSHNVNSTSTRGSRSGVDRYSSRSNMTHYGGSDVSAPRGKAPYKKENGAAAYASSAIGMSGNNVNRRQSPHSEASTEKTISYNTVPETIAVAPPSSGFQSAWSGMPGQVSMADIVKMGRPQGKASTTSTSSQQHINNHPPLGTSAYRAPHDSHSSQNHVSNVVETNTEMSGHVPSNDDWPLEEETPVTSVSVMEEPTVESETYGDPYDGTKQQFRSQSDEVRFEADDFVDNAHTSFVQSISDSNRTIQEDNLGSASGYENDLYQDISSCQVHQREVENTSASVQSVNNNLQSLSLSKEDEDAPSEDDGPAVKIPDHLQVQSSECSHLSFGSFGSGTTAPFPGSFGARTVQSNEEAAVSAEAPYVGHSEARNSEYYEEEHLRTTPDVNTAHRIGGSSGNFETPSVSQEDLKQEAPEVGQVNQYPFPPSTDNYAFENGQQLNPSFANLQTSSQIQGLPSLSDVMPYTNALPNTLLASNVQHLREADLAYSPFPISQSMASKFSNSVPSISGPAASMAEALKQGNFSASQSTQSIPGGSNIPGGAGLPQHMAVHLYSQPSVPMGPFPAANMIGYPFLPQSYTYMPSAFQQAFAAGNSTYPQSLAAALLPQYKNSASVSSLAQAAAVPSGYGAFGNSNSIPNNFPLNPPSAPAGTSINYDDILSSQYKDASQLLSLQQGPGSRTLSGVPGSTYYNSFQGQNQQPAGFRQSQQPSQHYGAPGGYPNFYHSQSGISLDHQQQMSRDGSLSGSQGQPPKQNQQLWQNSY